jgi:hypothetical protein
MVALVSVETVLLVLLVILVAGLLRSHAAIMRRLGPEDQGEPARPEPAQPEAVRVSQVPGRGAAATGEAPALSGVTASGDAVGLAFTAGAPTLLAFLTSGCSSCAEFWDSLGERRLPAGVRTVIVAHGAERERPAKLRGLAPDGIPVVMSDRAWSDYEIPGSPYFVLVDGSVLGEGVATTWHALASLVGDALEDQREAREARSGDGDGDGDRHGGERRAARIDDTLAAAGIGPGHPSLYPDRAPRP